MDMKKFKKVYERIQGFTFIIAQTLELILALVVVAALLIVLLQIPSLLAMLWASPNKFSTFLEKIFEVIIGIEFLKMLYRHDLDSVVEVLLFAVARSLIIEHMPIYFTLCGIVAIAILFVIRKFLFVSAIDKHSEDEENRKDDKTLIRS